MRDKPSKNQTRAAPQKTRQNSGIICIRMILLNNLILTIKLFCCGALADAIARPDMRSLNRMHLPLERQLDHSDIAGTVAWGSALAAGPIMKKSQLILELL
ncbi:hypothetical protein [Burkholderia sp. Ac-20344]|uniref:hypothetical protein n=1 Tax=Burkholderia sp. Ac-20344 TaxID=2703890 RepID=UPI00197B37C1|nr:hypothetical protein [Burkholderia sp. Ac-20344]MBN3836259.1 hypothetical protein [Burkholderia sp. Ac-20344]